MRDHPVSECAAQKQRRKVLLEKRVSRALFAEGSRCGQREIGSRSEEKARERADKEKRDYTSSWPRNVAAGTASAVTLPMPLEAESYLNAPRISEIELFHRAAAHGRVYLHHFALLASSHNTADAHTFFLPFRRRDNLPRNHPLF